MLALLDRNTAFVISDRTPNWGTSKVQPVSGYITFGFDKTDVYAYYAVRHEEQIHIIDVSLSHRLKDTVLTYRYLRNERKIAEFQNLMLDSRDFVMKNVSLSVIENTKQKSLVGAINSFVLDGQDVPPIFSDGYAVNTVQPKHENAIGSVIIKNGNRKEEITLGELGNHRAKGMLLRGFKGGTPAFIIEDVLGTPTYRKKSCDSLEDAITNLFYEEPGNAVGYYSRIHEEILEKRLELFLSQANPLLKQRKEATMLPKDLLSIIEIALVDKQKSVNKPAPQVVIVATPTPKPPVEDYFDGDDFLI